MTVVAAAPFCPAHLARLASVTRGNPGAMARTAARLIMAFTGRGLSGVTEVGVPSAVIQQVLAAGCLACRLGPETFEALLAAADAPLPSRQ